MLGFLSLFFVTERYGTRIVWCDPKKRYILHEIIMRELYGKSNVIV